MFANFACLFTEFEFNSWAIKRIGCQFIFSIFHLRSTIQPNVHGVFLFTKNLNIEKVKHDWECSSRKINE